MLKYLIGLGACLAITTTAIAADNHKNHNDHNHAGHDHSRPDSHAPIGVMRSHVHDKGEWMLSYRFAYTMMDGNRTNTSSVSTADVLADYMVAPTQMPMMMHMIGGMYGITDTFTVGIMGGYMDMEMDHQRRNGTTFIMENDGFTDTSVNGMYQFYNDGTHHLQFNAGLSLPTGSINDRKPNGSIFGYAMQTGSGTYDLLSGISYAGQSDSWSWGGQFNTVLRLGRNNRGYTLGDRFQLTGWTARKLSNSFSASLRLDGHAWDEIKGQDRDISPPFMAPPMDSSLFGGERIDVALGANYAAQSGLLKGHRLSTEFIVPVYQRLDGPRLETNYKIIVGWQKIF